jgi:hypothetical protein
MALLTDEQLHAIREIVRKHHQAFVVNVIGPEAMPPEVLDDLQRAGLIDTELSSIEDAYRLGQAIATGHPEVARMGLAEFQRWLRKNPVPLTQQERRAVEVAQHHAATYAVGLGNRVDGSINERIVVADRALAQKIRDDIKTATAANIARRQTIKDLVSDLKWSTKDWARDWDRIAITEKHRAMQQGVADGYSKQYGPDVRVAIREMPDACEHCKRLNNGSDGQPRIFPLSLLEANGTNYGRKAKDWQPVLPPVHPHCQGQVVRIPPGWGFDATGALVPGGELGESYNSNKQLKRALEESDALRKAVSEGHVKYQGIPIAIETAKGQTRKWTDAQGEQGETLMLYDYGYIRRTGGADGEEVDVYLGPNGRAPQAFIVHQLDPVTGMYDEDKMFLGFLSAASARVAFQAHRNDEGAFGGMTSMTIDQLKRWLSGTAIKPGHDASKQRVKLTVPLTQVLRKSLEKRTQGDLRSSGTIATEFGAQDSPAGNRNPGHGTMVNFMEGNVGRWPVRMNPALEGWDPRETNPGEVEQMRVHVDADDYHLTVGGQARQPLKVMPIPEGIASALYTYDEEAEKRSIEDLKAWLEHQDVANRQRPRNNVDVEQE